MTDLNDQFKLRTNPFRLTPATNPEELIWAGFPEIKSKFEKRIERSMRIPNSTLVLNWGEYGSGKTHAARYFSKKDVLDALGAKAGKPAPYSIVLSLPKGKEPIYSIYVSIIDKLDIEALRELFADLAAPITAFIDAMGSNIHLKNVIKSIFNPEIDHFDVKKYLYGNMTTADLRKLNTHGILRQLKDDTDYTSIIAGIFSCLTFEKSKFSCVVVWIDEFEDIAVLNNSNIDKTNNFIREILDNAPNNLLVFLNLTQSALIGVEDLGQYVYESVRSRIKERISFDIPNPENFKIYVQELLVIFRESADANPYFPYEEDTINKIIADLGSVSLRQFNEAMSILLELADMEGKCPITVDFLEENHSEIIWNKE